MLFLKGFCSNQGKLLVQDFKQNFQKLKQKYRNNIEFHNLFLLISNLTLQLFS